MARIDDGRVAAHVDPWSRCYYVYHGVILSLSQGICHAIVFHILLVFDFVYCRAHV
jgi:hypothetical protein